MSTKLDKKDADNLGGNRGFRR